MTTYWKQAPAAAPEPRGAVRRAAPGAAGPAPQDPYATWAALTEWRCYRRRQDGTSASTLKSVRILAAAPDRKRFLLILDDKRFEIPDLYRGNALLERLPDDGPRHFTAKVAWSEMAGLAEEYGLRWELAVPLRDAQTEVQANPLGLFGEAATARESKKRYELPDPSGAAPKPTGRRYHRRRPSRDGVIAVIDYGAPFLHQNFLDTRGRRTRIRALWDQELRLCAPAPSWWQTPLQTGYGRELDGSTIDTMLQAVWAGAGGQALDEAKVYRTQDYLVAYNDPRRRSYVTMHGAHVLDMAGGRHDPLQAWRPRVDGQAGDAADAAGEAALVFVQLPALTASDSSGSSLGAQVLDAVHYVLSVCHPEERVVINISYGNAAGAHDGTSLLEEALDTLLECRPDNFAIVLAAGNSGNADCHSRRVVRSEHSARLRVAIEPEDTTDTFVEIWYEPLADDEPQLAARVRTPARDWSDWIAPGQQAVLLELGDRRPVALLQHVARPAGSRSQSVIQLSMAPTGVAVDDDGPLADVGLWEIEVCLQGGAGRRAPKDGDKVRIDAWVERDDPGDIGVGAQPHFVEVDDDDRFNTLSGIGTGRHTVVVGGYRIDGHAPADYSSLPDPRRPRDLPFVLAPCEEDGLQPGLLAAAVRSTDTFRMNGTSVAAPAVARLLFNEMSAGVVARHEWPQRLRDLAARQDSLIRLLPDG